MEEKKFELKPAERVDDLQISGLGIIQESGRFCFGMDAVLLSGFARIRKGERVIDLGTGTGILPLLLYAKTEAEHFIGLEIQPESADMARRSVAGNNLTDKIDIITGDIKEASSIFGKKQFNVVTSNPPYMVEMTGIKNPQEPKAIARHEILCNFDDIAREAKALLVQGGRFYLVHRPVRLPELFVTLKKYGLEPKRMRLIYPYADREPNMVLIEAIEGARPMLKIEKPLIVYDRNGNYSEEMVEEYKY